MSYMGIKGFGFFTSCLFVVSCSHDPWVPDAGWQETPQRGDVAHCDNQYVSRMLVDETEFGPDTHGLLLKGFFNRCEKTLGKENLGKYEQLSKSVSIQYEYHRSKSMKTVEFNVDRNLLDDFKVEEIGETIPNKEDRFFFKTQLFLQPTKDPRPLVIVKCGLQCELGNASLKYLLAILYDEGPFHVLLVPNITSRSFQVQNHVITAGGLEEGRHLVSIAKFIQSDSFEYKNRVSRVHVAGVSLGGHAALYASLYNSFERKPDGEKYISTVFAGCPVVNLKDSIEGLYDGSTLGNVFEKYFWKQFKEISYFVPVAGQIIKDIDEKDKSMIVPQIFAEGALDYFKKVTASTEWGQAPFRGVKIETTEDLWKFNNFVEYSDYNSTPTFIWASQDDPIVKSPQNIEKLIQKHGRVPNEFYQILLTKHGYHCGFTDAYTWKVAGETIRSIFVSRSPELMAKRRMLNKKILYDALVRPLPRLDNSKFRERLQWQASIGSTKLKLRHQFGDWCDDDEGCMDGVFETRTQPNVFAEKLIRIPSLDVETQQLTRWANANVFVSGRYLGWLDKREHPQTASWYQYDSPGIHGEINSINDNDLSPAYKKEIIKKTIMTLILEGQNQLVEIVK